MPAMTRAGRRLSANQSQENTIVINADHPIQPEKPMAMKKTARKRGALTDISNNVPTKKRTTLKQNPKSMNLQKSVIATQLSVAKATPVQVQLTPDDKKHKKFEKMMTQVDDASDRRMPSSDSDEAPSVELTAASIWDKKIRNIDATLASKINSYPSILRHVDQHYRENEMKYHPGMYFENSQLSQKLKPSMRTILIDWLVEVGIEYHLCPQTLYLGVNYLDRTIAAHLTMTRSNLQLLGCACILLACKFQEVSPPQADEFVYISDNTYSLEQMLEMETLILSCLDYRLSVVTPISILERYIHLAQLPDLAANVARYISELVLLEYHFLQFKPSKISAAIIIYSNLILESDSPWPMHMEWYTKYRVKDLRECIIDIKCTHMCEYSDLTEKDEAKAVTQKYLNKKYLKAAKYGPASDEDMMLKQYPF